MKAPECLDQKWHKQPIRQYIKIIKKEERTRNFYSGSANTPTYVY